jgi:hypothetical protein
VSAAQIQGTPKLEAKVLGTSELVPGTDVTLTVLISNTASIENVINTNENREYDSLIALGVKATPHAGDGALTIKSDTVMIGDLAPGAQGKITVYATVAQDAAPGIYSLPLTLSYNYVSATEEYRTESVRMYYVPVETVTSAPITIAANVQMTLHDISVDSLNVGHEGFVIVEVENTGHETGYNTVAHIYSREGSPLVPVDGTVFIGEFAPGQKESLAFKLKVDSKAEPKEYPSGIMLEYTDSSGLSQRTDPRMFGVPIGEKLTFAIVDNKVSIYPGETKIFELEIVNTGVTTANGAQAKMSVLTPFTAVTDLYSLSDLKAGESAVAQFTIAVDSAAVLKQYKLDIFVRYKDDLNNSRVSDAMSLTVDVVERTGFDAFVHNVQLVSVCIGALVIILYSLFAVRKERQGK